MGHASCHKNFEWIGLPVFTFTQYKQTVKQKKIYRWKMDCKRNFKRPYSKDDNTRFTTIPLKVLSNKVWIRYSYFWFFELFIFICDFSAKKTRISCLYEARKKFTEINTVWVKKPIVTSTFLMRVEFHGSRCESAMA